MTCASGSAVRVELSEARATRRVGGSVAVVRRAMTEAAPRARREPRRKYVRRMVRESPGDHGMRNGCLFPCANVSNRNGGRYDPCARDEAILSSQRSKAARSQYG